jgi:hypothetical protein
MSIYTLLFMEPFQAKFPLVKLPSGMEQTLYLIREELKSRKLFWALHEVGLDDCYFQPHLDSLILRGLGIDSSDENFTRYMDIMDKRSKKIDADQQSITKQALKAYNELLKEKEKIKEGAMSR